jgi:hypothetical protein
MAGQDKTEVIITVLSVSHLGVIARKNVSAPAAGPTVPSIRDAAITTDTTGSSTSANMPTHQTNDILLCYIGTARATATTNWTVPSGWTDHYSAGDGGQFVVISKRAASDSETVTIGVFNTGGTEGRDIRIVSIKDAITTGNWWDYLSITTDTVASQWNTSTHTPTVSDGLTLFIGASFPSSESWDTAPPPTGWTTGYSDVGNAHIYLATRDAATIASTQIDGLTIGDASTNNRCDHEGTITVKPIP